MENRFFAKLVVEIDDDGDGMINVGEFLRYFAVGSTVRPPLPTTWTVLEQDGPDHLGL